MSRLYFVAIWMTLFACCRTADTTKPAGASRVDRLVSAYPELRAGRFALLADFEDASHGELFHAADTSTGMTIERTSVGSGGTNYALRSRFASQADSLLVDNDWAEHWYLKRDWRDYDLLLLTVDAPVAGVDLRFSIQSGAGSRIATAQTRIRLIKGHNVVRLELAELGEQIALDDVRALRIDLDKITRSIALTFDDFILTRDREQMLGDPRGAEGMLYASRVGRRWVVGAAGRFELTFGNGQVVAWYDLTSDPQRLHNLVQETVLGPEWYDGDDAANSASAFAVGASASTAGPSDSVHTTLIEANSIRIRLKNERRTGGRVDSIPSSQVPQEWHYTIYSGGQVFVDMECVHPESISTESPALTVGLGQSGSWSVRNVPVIHRASGASAGPASAAAIAMNTQSSSSILFAPYLPGATFRIEERPDSSGTTSLLATSDPLRGRAASEGNCAVIYLRLGSHEWTADEARAQVGWYFDPEAPTIEAGSFQEQQEPYAQTTGGWSRALGSFQIAAIGNLVRLTLPESMPDGLPIVFEVSGLRSRRAWVYVDHRLLEGVVRTSDDALLFTVPLDTPRTATVEVQIDRS